MSARDAIPCIALICFLTGSAAGQDLPFSGGDPEKTYEMCMTAARGAPERALEMARVWFDEGGGEAAVHCGAVALIGLGDPRQAAERLEKLSGESRRGPDVRAGLLAQAAQAWMIAEEPAKAEAAQTAALVLRPDDPALLIDRAVSRSEEGLFWEAVDDLNQVLGLETDRVEALVLRANAYRALEVLDLARDDINRALELQPENQDALLERGLLHRVSGNDDEARKDWQKLIDVDPGSSVAGLAREHLTELDAAADSSADG